MNTKRLIFLLIASPFLLCLIFIGLFFGQRAAFDSLTQRRLALVAQDLPTPDRSVMVLSLAGQQDGGTEGCFYYTKMQIYGSNDLAFPEVLDFYSSALRTKGWNELSVGSNWRSFWLGDKEFVLSVSDDANLNLEELFVNTSYRTNQTTVDAAKKQYETIYVLSLTIYDLDPSRRKECQQF